MKTEKIVFGFFLISLAFKFLHIPGGGMLMVLSLSTLSLLYFGLGFYFFSVKNLQDQNLPLSIAAGIFLGMGVTGIMFKLMYWPGSGIMLAVPLPFILMFFLLPFLFFRKSENKAYYRRMQIRTGIIGMLALFLYFTPSGTLITLQHWDDPELARLKTKVVNHPENEKYHLELQNYLKSRN